MWRVYVAGPAKKALERIARSDRDRILTALREMTSEPFEGDVRKLGSGMYRRRVGSYRIFFELRPAIRFVQVSAIERRTSTTYRKR